MNTKMIAGVAVVLLGLSYNAIAAVDIFTITASKEFVLHVRSATSINPIDCKILVDNDSTNFLINAPAGYYFNGICADTYTGRIVYTATQTK